MLAMLRKDWYVMGKYTLWVSVGLVLLEMIFAWIPGLTGSICYVMPVWAVSVLLNAVHSDRACRWDRFAAMTPLPPRTLVLEKYLFAYSALLLLTMLSAAVPRIITGEVDGAALGISVVLSALAIAMALPLVYRYGRRKGGGILMAVWGIAAALLLGTARWNFQVIEWIFGWMEAVPTPALAVGLGAVLLAVNGKSFSLSVDFYTRRSRGIAMESWFW